MLSVMSVRGCDIVDAAVGRRRPAAILWAALRMSLPHPPQRSMTRAQRLIEAAALTLCIREEFNVFKQVANQQWLVHLDSVGHHVPGQHFMHSMPAETRLRQTLSGTLAQVNVGV